MQGRRLLAGGRVAEVQSVMANIIDQNVTAALETVAEIKHEEGIGVEPLCGTSVECDKADTGTQVRLPLQQGLSRSRRLQVEDGRAGEQHNVVFGQNEVVDNGRGCQSD